MKETNPGETATASAYASWSWTVVCLFISGIFFGSFVSGMLLRWKPLISSKFRALLGYQDESGSQLSQEDSASLHSLDSNISQDSSLTQQEDSACDHPPSESTSIITEGSSSSPRGYKYDVYLSFRGVDNRRSFIDYLNHRLLKEGILPFRDEVDLQRGEIISSALLQAIKDSRISIVVFSRGSANSTWCLDELVAIVDWHKEMKQEVLPVFYDVDPRDVRYQIGAYEDAFYKHRETFKEEPDKILKWKSAMKYLADLSGLTLTDLKKPEGIERIVEAVSDTLVYKFQRSRSTHQNPESSQRRPSLQEVNIYDVFLSLRPTHTHSKFIQYLYHYLTENGFSTFKSDAEIQKGESILSSVLQAIKDSRVFIVVFTRDYADSISSMEEMAAIVDCHRELNRTVIPVFYDIDPWDVGRQTGPYERAFISYTEKFKQDPHKVQRWREALKHVARLSGFALGDGRENETIWMEKIIKRVERLCPKFSRLSSQVGIQSSLATLEKRLKLNDDRVLVLGIWGMGGSGKTTHALALYDRIVQQFQGACFVQDVSRVYKVGGATALQKILHESLEEELSDMYSPFEISGSLERMLCREKILIVLDNVDGSRQLELLAINRNMLGMGSRIIITTRDRHVLHAYGVDEIYQVPPLNDAEARELFLSACPAVTNYEGCNELIPRVLAYAGGLPLVIRVLGSFLQHLDVTFWENTLDRLRRVPSFEIIKILQTSFDGLDQQEKEIFLHIACFFHGKKVDFVKEVLNCCGFLAEIGIQVLVDKSLISIEYKEEEIHMHHLLQKMGKFLVYQECLENPASRSRVWLKEDFSSALESKKEASEVKAIVLCEDTSIFEHEQLNIEGLSKMRNLRLLILYGQHFSGELTSLPKRLQYLLWDGYHFSYLPSFEPYNSLVQLNLPNNRIKRLWNGRQNFPNLERVDLSYSKELMETPNFEGSPRLKRLDFTGCTNLVRVDSSIGLLKELSYLGFRNCCRLVILDLDAGCNYDCKKLETKQDFTGLGLPNLEHLDLGDCTSLSKVHYSLGIPNKLKYLNLQGCINLVEIPDFSVFPRDGPKSNITEESSSSWRDYKYDVYLSFRGADTRTSFVDSLYNHLSDKGVLAFRDEELERGEIISSTLLEAIKDSRISIVVFSRGYARSKWCLDELVAIVDCHKDMKQELLPIFYDVNPFDVRYQRGAYEVAFEKHRKREGPEKINKWKSAMSYLSNISGLILRDLETNEGIHRVVEWVWDTMVYKFQISRSADKNPESPQTRPSLQEVNEYDVFLSLRSTDTPHPFVDHLYQYLNKRGFSTFKSDQGIERGESILFQSESQILQAIKNSEILIVVFTSDYADSTTCLEEMATIVDCHRELKQTVIPVFYDVIPRDVRRQTGPYEKAFISYTEESKQDPHKVQRWREALNHMASLSGFVLGDGPETEAIGNIIQTVERLCPKFSRLRSNSQVGMQSSLAKLEKDLKLEDDCVLVLGIWGMAGSGKTTHALALYDRIFKIFEGACFIQDVSQVYRVGGATALQRQILSESLKEKLSDIYSPLEISALMRKLYRKKILIVLDSVDELRQLECLAINRNMLEKGSRIVIATRDRHILNAYVDFIHEISLLNNDEARELFLRACPGVTKYEGYTELIPRVLQYAGGLPLAIKVLGSLLQYRDLTIWKSALDKLKRVPSFEIIKILKTSYDGLNEEEKEIFLHIACFFHGKKADFVKEVLDCCGFLAEIGIQVLMDKSLITIKNEEEEEIHMHNLLQDMGKEIVRQECPGNPASQSKLWHYEDVCFALKSKKEASEVKAIVLFEDTSISKHEQLNIEGLSKMRNLRLLILYNLHFSGKLTSLPKRLRYLLWDGYPFSSLPSFELFNSLVQLNLPNSHIKRLWNGCQNFPSLERVDLSCSKELMETPDFGGSPNLMRLDFTGCTNLVQVHPSIGLLKELTYLSFRDCYQLVTLNSDHECKLSSLRVLDLYSCTNLKDTPDFTGLPNLEHIDLGECVSLSTVHHSIGNLKKLKFLKVPASINLTKLGDVKIVQTPEVPSHGETEESSS